MATGPITSCRPPTSLLLPDGSEGQYKRRHLVYGKEGQPCPNQCGGVIQRLRGERSSYFCPHCQAMRSKQ
ncbi:MAG: hypothetical protein HP495_07730 [Nitrospira sp.]|nr:hypothetical protein [Nitrospira sp.]